MKKYLLNKFFVEKKKQINNVKYKKFMLKKLKFIFNFIIHNNFFEFSLVFYPFKSAEIKYSKC